MRTETGLVTRLVHDLKDYGLPVAGLTHEGEAALRLATKHFNPESGIDFPTYAGNMIKAALYSYVLNKWPSLGPDSLERRQALSEQLHLLQEQIARQGISMSRSQERVISHVMPNLGRKNDQSVAPNP